MSTRLARLRLTFLGLHPDRLRRLRGTLGPDALVERLRSGSVRVPEAGRWALDTSELELLERAAAAGSRIVMQGDSEFPEHLASLPEAPEVLFVRGRLVQEPGVAMVGTRRCSGYGRTLARSMGGAVGRVGWPVVSGLARGIDGEAHRGCVAAGGVGVAVLGSGIDVMYPREHAQLADALVDCGGAVITEYPPGTPPEGWRFPPRNRIIAGLAAAVVVVEAGEKGGAQITAVQAAEQGRSVFAVPGDVDRQSSVGCNLLIRDGAVPVLGTADLIEGLSLILGPVPPVAEHPLQELLGDGGRSLEWLAEHIDLPIHEVLGLVARYQAEGFVDLEDGVVLPKRT